MKSKEEILQRLEEARIEKESCDEAVREALISECIRIWPKSCMMRSAPSNGCWRDTMSNAAIRRFVAVMVTSYIAIAMIGAIGAWLFLAVPNSAQLNDARQQIDKLEDQLDVLEEGNRVLAEEVEVKETLIENLQWELENR